MCRTAEKGVLQDTLFPVPSSFSTLSPFPSESALFQRVAGHGLLSRLQPASAGSWQESGSRQALGLKSCQKVAEKWPKVSLFGHFSSLLVTFDHFSSLFVILGLYMSRSEFTFLVLFGHFSVTFSPESVRTGYSYTRVNRRKVSESEESDHF